MGWKQCVIDASMPVRGGMFNFCPIEGDIDGEFCVVTGMNYLSASPPAGLEFVAVIHPDGQEAAERFCEEHRDALRDFRR